MLSTFGSMLFYSFYKNPKGGDRNISFPLGLGLGLLFQ
jgi:hypothetical protein